MESLLQAISSQPVKWQREMMQLHSIGQIICPVMLHRVNSGEQCLAGICTCDRTPERSRRIGWGQNCYTEKKGVLECSVPWKSELHS